MSADGIDRDEYGKNKYEAGEETQGII